MIGREVIEWKVNLKDTKLEQKLKVYVLIAEHCDAFCLQDEIETCPHIEVNLKLYDDVPLFNHIW